MKNALYTVNDLINAHHLKSDSYLIAVEPLPDNTINPTFLAFEYGIERKIR